MDNGRTASDFGGGLWIHMAIPGLGGRDTSRDFWFSISGDPYGGGTRE